MAAFYIDFENVHNMGTTGIEELSDNEYVYLFYSQNANCMNMETVSHFLRSRCGVQFVEADTGTANSLDFQLISFLFYGVNQDDYHYIISKDHGFDAAIKMAKRMGLENIKRYNTIAEALRNYQKQLSEAKQANMDDSVEDIEANEKEEIQDETSECNIDEKKYQTIVKDRIKKLVQKESNIALPREELEISYDGICTCDNKMKLYHYLRSQLGDKKGRCVYSALNDEFMQLKFDLAI